MTSYHVLSSGEPTLWELYVGNHLWKDKVRIEQIKGRQIFLEGKEKIQVER